MQNDQSQEQNQRLDFKEVRAAADDHWDHILERLAPHHLGEALQQPGKKVYCPFHQSHKKGTKDFRVDKHVAGKGTAICTCGAWGGFQLLMDIHGWDIKTAMTEVAEVLWGVSRVVDQPPAPSKPKHDHVMNAKYQRTNERVWNETISLSDPEAQVAIAYFNRRGIYWRSLEGMDGTLRFHPALDFYDSDEQKLKGKWPAIIARMTDVHGNGLTLHRTYLDESSLYTGKAKAKKLRPYPDTLTLHGGAIMLGPIRPIIGVCEGIETALSIREATGLTVWPCYCDWLMGAFTPPEGVVGLISFGDRDPKQAGKIACDKLDANVGNDIAVKRFIPGQQGDKLDWNDVLMSQGISGFAEVFDYLELCKQRYNQHKEKQRVAS